MHRFFKTWLTRVKINMVLLMVITVLLIVFAITVRYDSRKYGREEDYSLKSISWERQEGAGKRDVYYLAKGKTALIITCKEKRLTITDLANMSIVRVIDKGVEYRLPWISINGKLWYVPVINENPNPTQEQKEFLLALTHANFLSFEINGVRHTWSTANNTTLSHCVDLY